MKFNLFNSGMGTGYAADYVIQGKYGAAALMGALVLLSFGAVLLEKKAQ